MTISHILILLAFICLGSMGITSAQEGLVIVWRHIRGHLPVSLRKTTSPMRSMKIV
tara:strand:- start:78 stop:245 length:168 start_codon:yes stop_codon:yes gene_type:complete